MIPQAFITAWRAIAPWADDAQVEQDLVLSRVVVELFQTPQLADNFALRGGTALNKLFVLNPMRYSEDIDLVQMTAAPIGPIIELLRAKFDHWLGNPHRDSSEKMFTLTYRFHSEIGPVRPMRLKIEINTREHFTVLGYDQRRFTLDSRWFSGTADITTYQINELLGTKLRALYQRKKGRDLFDLWLCLETGTIREPADPDVIVKCFNHYMAAEGHPVSRPDFESNLSEKAHDEAFLSDITPLLASHVSYDAQSATRRVLETLIHRLGADPEHQSVQKNG